MQNKVFLILHKSHLQKYREEGNNAIQIFSSGIKISSHTSVHGSHPLVSHAGVCSVRIAQPPEHLGEGGLAVWSRVIKKSEARNENVDEGIFKSIAALK